MSPFHLRLHLSIDTSTKKDSKGRCFFKYSQNIVDSIWIFLYSWRTQVRMVTFLDIVIQVLMKNCYYICFISSIYFLSFNNVNIFRESSTASYYNVLQDWHIQTKYPFHNLNLFFIKNVMITWSLYLKSSWLLWLSQYVNTWNFQWARHQIFHPQITCRHLGSHTEADTCLQAWQIGNVGNLYDWKQMYQVEFSGCNRAVIPNHQT